MQYYGSHCFRDNTWTRETQTHDGCNKCTVNRSCVLSKHWIRPLRPQMYLLYNYSSDRFHEDKVLSLFRECTVCCCVKYTVLSLWIQVTEWVCRFLRTEQTVLYNMNGVDEPQRPNLGNKRTLCQIQWGCQRTSQNTGNNTFIVQFPLVRFSERQYSSAVSF